MDEKFDGNNWSLIHETKQVVTPNPNVVNIGAPAAGVPGPTTTTKVTATTDPKLMSTLEKLVDSGREKKQEPLKAWDATTQTGAPNEVIKRNANRLNPNYFMTKNEMTLFNNELTKKNNGTTKVRPYVLVPLNGIGYIIFHDGTLYQHLFLQHPRLRKLFIDNFPKLKGMNHHDWYDFGMELQMHAFLNSTFIFPYHCQERNRNNEGFNMGDPELSDDVDVLIIYNNVKDLWNSQLFEGLSQPGTLPSEAKNILKASNNNGLSLCIICTMHITLSLCLF